MLVIARDSTYADRLRAYSLWLDGKRLGKIRDGEIRRFDIAPGSHTINLRIDWAKSKTLNFESKNNSDSIFECYSSVGGRNLFNKGLSVYSRATINYAQYITLEQVSAIDPNILKRVDYKSSHPIPKNKALTVFLTSLALVTLLPIIVQLNSLSFNPVSHMCVTNTLPQDVKPLVGPGIISPKEAQPPRGFCQSGFHPELNRSWMLIDETLIATSLGILAPIVLSSGMIYILRASKAQSDPMLRR